MALNCPQCGFELREAFFESPEYKPCLICGSELSVLPFPACFATPTRIAESDLHRAEEENSCFHHESKKAVHACTQCGKFLCALCAAEVGSDILCPACLVGREQKRTDVRLERERTLYDSIALTLAIAPALTISLSIFGAPAAVYVALRYWRRPTSIVRRSRWRQYAALLLGIAEILGWAALFITLVYVRRTVR
jgi:hypothetical protein